MSTIGSASHIEKLDVLEAQRDQIDHLRAELLVSQHLNAELLEALKDVARADALDGAQTIAALAIALAIAREGHDR
jgi:hypothetical protein